MILDKLKRAHVQTDVKGKRRRSFISHIGTPAAGIKVTPSSALTYTAVYAAVSILAGTVASLPFGVRKKLKDGNTESAEGHDVHRLLSEEPNGEMTGPVFWENFVCKMLLWGNGFAEIERARNRKPVALWYIPSDVVTMMRDEKTNELFYEVRIMSGKPPVQVLPRNMFHVPDLGDGLMGLSRISLARQSISASLAMEQHAGSLFGQGAMPMGVLKITGELDDEAHDRLSKTFDAAYRGSHNSGRTVILEEGAEFSPLTMPSDDAQFLQTRVHHIDDMARLFRVPPHMLAQMKDATFSNIEHQGRSFERHSIRLLVCKIAREANRKLLGGAKSQYYAHFDVDDLLMGDSEARSEFNERMRNAGAFSVNDILRREGLSTIGTEGDVRIAPMNFTSLEFLRDNPGGIAKIAGAPDSTPKEKGKSGVRDVLYPQARDIAGRLWHKGSSALARMAKKKSGEPLATELSKWFREAFEPDVRKAIGSFIQVREMLTHETLAVRAEASRIVEACRAPMMDVFRNESPEAFDSYVRDYGFESPDDIANAIMKGLDHGAAVPDSS